MRAMERRLYEASLSGCVDTLNALIQEDQLTLDRVAVTCFHETPLHIAALRGHLQFTITLLNQKPKLATELDSCRRSPLHLASAEGYDDIVQKLLSVNLGMCDVRDRDGRIPLHLAIMKGRLEVIKKLITARPESTQETLDHGETILHLAVNCCNFEVLKLLVESMNDVDEFLNSQDSNGNTILHLASILKQQEMVKYLLSTSGVKANKNAMNKNGLTALDVLEHCPRDVKGMEIQCLLREAGVGKAKELKTPSPSSSSQQEVAVNHHPNEKSKIKRWLKNLSSNYKGEKWYKERQGTLMLVATVFATMTFQAAINPPGGVWQEDVVAIQGSSCGLSYKKCFAGHSILAYSDPNLFDDFSTYNKISLVASLSIILLILSGFPLKNRICMWLLILTMCTTVVFMISTYRAALTMVKPKASNAEAPAAAPNAAPNAASNKNDAALPPAWLLMLLALGGFIFVARFFYSWVVKRLPKVTPSGMMNESELLGA